MAKRKSSSKSNKNTSRRKTTKAPAAAKSIGTTGGKAAKKKVTKEPSRPRVEAKKKSVSEAVSRSLENLKEKIEAAKFYTPAVQVAEVQPPFQDLPQNYGDNKIVLMVRDPYWVHCYWEINQSRIEEARAQFGDLWDQTKPILRVYDITNVQFNGENANGSFDIELTGNATNWYINVGAPNRSYCVDIGIVAPDNRFFVLARSNPVVTPRDGMSEILDEQWMDIDCEKMYALSGGFDVGAGSLELRELMEKKLRAEEASGAVPSLAMVSPVKYRERGFWFILGTELIVYGATTPDAKVTLQGKRVRLRPDGTFTLRLALPDGVQRIETTATSPDGTEVRTITPTVTKKTESKELVLTA